MKVKEFAGMMVKDNGMANEELMSIVNMKNMNLPALLDEEHSKKLEELISKSGKDFDKAYVAAMIERPSKTLSLVEVAEQNCKD